MINLLNPDIVIIDYHNSGENGIDLMPQKHLRDFELIVLFPFTDDVPHNKTHKRSAEYVKLPIENRHLEHAINNCKINIVNKKLLASYIQTENDNKTNELLPAVYEDFICLLIDNIYKTIKTIDIYSIRGDDPVTYFKGNFGNGIFKPIINTNGFSHWKKRLNPASFWCCHQSYLVNKDHIDSYSPLRYYSLIDNIKVEGAGGTLTMKYEEGGEKDKLPVSREKRKFIKKKLGI